MATADQFDIDPQVAAETAAAADVLAERIEREGDAIAWANLEQGLERYEAETGAPADELLPDDVSSLAFAGLDRAREYARKVVCSRRDEIRTPIEAGINGGSAGLTLVLFATLGLPAAAAAVVPAIAAVLMVRGLDGFCASANTAPA